MCNIGYDIHNDMFLRYLIVVKVYIYIHNHTIYIWFHIRIGYNYVL